MGTAQPQRTLSHPQEASQTERTPETVGFFSAIYFIGPTPWLFPDIRATKFLTTDKTRINTDAQ